MYYISTYPLAGRKLVEFAAEIQLSGLNDIGFELFYDNIPFYEAKYYEHFLHGIKLGMHCPMEGCCLLSLKGSLEFEYTLEKHKACFEIAQGLGAEYVVVHTNSLSPRSAEEIAVQKALLPERMAMTADIAKEYGLRIAVENVGFGYNSSLVADMGDFTALAENPELDFLIDTGHAHANGWDIPALVETLGDRIAGFHFHDNDGASDSHFPIGCGNTDWNGVFSAISRFAEKADRTVEYAAPYSDELLNGIRLLKDRLDEKSEGKYE